MNIRRREISGSDVVALLRLLAEHRIEVWVDGGWGVDALLGEQTRPHSDVDIAIRHDDVPRLRELLEARGYKDVPRDDTRDCNFVLGDDHGREVDVHSFTLTRRARLSTEWSIPLSRSPERARSADIPCAVSRRSG